MSTTKHGEWSGEGPFTSEFDEYPGIDRSPALRLTSEDIDLFETDDTQEGDVENDAGANGERARAISGAPTSR